MSKFGLSNLTLINPVIHANDALWEKINVNKPSLAYLVNYDRPPTNSHPKDGHESS